MSGAGPYVRIFNALKAANVPDAQAADAADALMAIKDDEIRSIRADIKVLQADIAELKADVRLLKWMLGVNLTMSSAILLRLLFPGLFQ